MIKVFRGELLIVVPHVDVDVDVVPNVDVTAEVDETTAECTLEYQQITKDKAFIVAFIVRGFEYNSQDLLQ